jgi:surface antigen
MDRALLFAATYREVERSSGITASTISGSEYAMASMGAAAMNTPTTILISIFVAALCGCQSTNIGQDLGRDLGNMLGRDSGFSRGGHYGSKMGKWLESEIFANLDAREEAELSVATQRAAETGKSESWGSKGSTAHGSATAKAPASAESSCRIVEQSATLPDGRKGTKQVRACKSPDGSWTIKPVT